MGMLISKQYIFFYMACLVSPLLDTSLHMKKLPLLLFLCYLLFAGIQQAIALPYDYTASIECLHQPHKPQYGGGIIINPDFNQGLKGWSTCGGAKVEKRELRGNKFAVAHGRCKPYDSVSQKLYLKRNIFYTFSAWIQVSSGTAPVSAIFKTESGFRFAGGVVAESNCWSMLKGGLTVNESGISELYFESNNTSIEVWVDSISLQPFTQQEWRSHQEQSTHKERKGKLSIQAVDKQGNPIPNATISIEQKALSYPFGCAINNNILKNDAYKKWFLSKGFKVTTFENEMKWYSNEVSRGQVNYMESDQMLQLAKQNNISVRGHNILWDDLTYQPSWVKSLSRNDLRVAAENRINSVVSRYKDQLIGWDVINENLHHHYFESILGQNFTKWVYTKVQSIDREIPLFLNEFNTIEESGDSKSSPASYLRKLRDIQAFPGNENIKFAIGLESHFSTPNIPYMRSAIDTLAQVGLPIWLTEVDVKQSPQRAKYLDTVLREGYSHPKVNGIVMWAAWRPEGCYSMCLTDNNFNNLDTGAVVDNLLREWGRGFNVLSAKTDSKGFFETSVFHGDYQVKLRHPTTLSTSLTQIINVASNEQNLTYSISIQ